MQFYVLPSLPGGETASKTLRLDEKTLAELRPVGSVNNNSSGRAAIDFPVTAGRYIMLRWNPATSEDTTFGIAEVAAFGASEPPKLIAASMTRTERELDTSDGKDFSAGKDFGEGKDFKEAKEAPAEAPAEAPITPLPPPPPFVFIPLVPPVSPD